MIRKVPLIVILGSTGTGKTKLSIQLAERLGGEIISADSMQVYSKLDIVTAKATQREQARAKHHLLDIAKPGEPFTVVNFRDAALPIIDDLLSRSKIPIVVGGTNYYIESLLWNMLVPNDSDLMEETKKTDIKITENLMETKKTSEELHELLKKVDPVTANRLHPNNRRKVIRALEVYQLSGQTLSSIFETQRSQPGGNRLGGALRYPHTILFWIRCTQAVLDERLNCRVESMVDLGLLPELRNFYNDHFIGSSVENPFTKGVLQMIGFKEFMPYLEKFNEEHDIKNEAFLKANYYVVPEAKAPPIDPENNPEGLDVLLGCLDRLKLVTSRYSRQQIKWIRNRFLSSIDRQVPDLYQLDSSDVSLWSDGVLLPAMDVVSSYIKGKQSKYKPLEKLQHPAFGLNEETTNHCPICDRIFIGEFQYRLHLKSNKHKRKKESLKKKEKLSAGLPEISTSAATTSPAVKETISDPPVERSTAPPEQMLVDPPEKLIVDPAVESVATPPEDTSVAPLEDALDKPTAATRKETTVEVLDKHE